MPHLKRVEKIILERDEIWVSTRNGRKKMIVDPGQVYAGAAARNLRRAVAGLVAR